MTPKRTISRRDATACLRPPPRYSFSMTARDVIDQIKALPSEERAKVFAFIHAAKTGDVENTDAAFAESARWVFEEHRELMRKLSQ